MSGPFPWFRCRPAPLLAEIAGMEADEAHVYLVLLLQIFETGGPVIETSRSLSRRTGLRENKVVAAVEALFTAGKLERLADGRLDSASTHDEIAWQNERQHEQSKAGKASAKKRTQRRSGECELEPSEIVQQNQRSAATSVERPSNHREEDRDREKEKEEKERTTVLRSAERPPLGGGRATPNLRPEKLTSRRGSAGKAGSAEQVWIRIESPQWSAWCDYIAAIGEKPPKAHTSKWHPGEGYAFPAAWPPSLGYREAAE